MTISAIPLFPSTLQPVDYAGSFGRYSLKIWSGGFCRFDTNPTNHRHLHETYNELCLVIDGQGEFTHGADNYKLLPGTLFFSEKNTAHEIASFRQQNLYLVFFNLAISQTTAPISSHPFDSAIHRFMLGHALVLKDSIHLLPYIQVICNSGTTGFDLIRRREAAGLFILDALDCLSIQKNTAQTNTAGVTESRNIVASAVAFIEANISRQISVSQIADACGCSDRHLRRLFSKETGKSILEVINERRISLAAQQLLMRFSVTQVAESLHMSSVAHFSRLFKRYHGMGPKEYQTQNAPRVVLPKTVFRAV